MNVHHAIQAVMKGISDEGVSKSGQAPANMGSYWFRGIDDVYNALSPLLAEHGLIIVPEVLQRVVTERKTAKGNFIKDVALEVRYRFIAAEDGSELQVGPFWGEGMDSGDKATNKALSAAYKYACFEVFCIPLEGNDSEAAEVPTVSPVDMTKVEGFVSDIDRCFVMSRTERNREVAECVDESELRSIMGSINAVDDDGQTKQTVWRQLHSSVRSYIRDMERVDNRGAE